MIIERGLDPSRRTEGAVVTVGTFDGVHLGHRKIMQRVNQLARAHNVQAVVVTFDPHPQTILGDKVVPLLSTIEERATRLSRLGIDRLVVIPFTMEFSRTPPETFVEDILFKTVGMRHMVIGHDHGFGRDRDGGREMLTMLGERLEFEIHVVSPQAVTTTVVSSSKIRRFLREDGDVRSAANMLGRPYGLQGEVVPGQARGRSIGFPTANIEEIDPAKLIPKKGVYAVEVYRRKEKKSYFGMLNIGKRPTFSLDQQQYIEVHLFDFRSNLYGEILRIRFAERIREERRFDSIDALTDQLRRDQERSKQVLERMYGWSE